MANRMIILLCLLCCGCNVEKKLSSNTVEHKEKNASRELFDKSFLDSLFRSHLKISISYTKEDFLPDTNSRSYPAETTSISPMGKPDKPMPVSREQFTLDIQSDVEKHVQEGDSLVDKSAVRKTADSKTTNTQTKERSVSWKFLIWISLLLVLVASTIYCAKKKINPFVQLLKLLRKCL